MSPKVTRIILVTKSLVFMRFSSISINLLEFFRIMSFVFDLKYLSQNSINFNMLGVFWNPQDKQFPKLSLDLHFEQHLKEILRVLDRCRCCLPPLYVGNKDLFREFYHLVGLCFGQCFLGGGYDQKGWGRKRNWLLVPFPACPNGTTKCFSFPIAYQF